MARGEPRMHRIGLVADGRDRVADGFALGTELRFPIEALGLAGKRYMLTVNFYRADHDSPCADTVLP